MKATLISMLILLSTCNLFAQIEKGKSLMTVSGNYRNDGIIENGNNQKSNALNVGASVGYFFSNRLVAGVGLDYNLQKDVPYYGTNQFAKLQIEGFIPYVYMGYYIPIVPKLYFNTDMKVSMGHNNNIFTGSYINKYTVGTAYFNAQVTPGLSYFFMKHVGTSLGFGGISYTTSESLNADNTNWLVNFNPSYWQLGVKVIL